MCFDGLHACTQRRKAWGANPTEAVTGPSKLPGAGNGLFAPTDRGYSRGQFITFYSGKYGYSLSGNRVLEMENGVCIDGSDTLCRSPGARGDMINDSRRRANCKFVVTSERLALVSVLATRRIFPGGEIYADYSKPCLLC